MKVYKVVMSARLNEVEVSIISGPQGQGIQEKVAAVQITECSGEGSTPKEACEKAMENGFAAYLEGLSEAGDKVKLFAPGAARDQ